MSAAVRLEIEGRIAKIRLDAPDKHNVLDKAGWLALAEACEGLADRDDLGCVQLLGSGGRAFSAGSDISAFEEQRSAPEDVRAYSDAIASALRAVRDCPHPTVAVIEGLCVGGGLEIAVCCDVRVCGASSRFGAPINRLGVTMAYEELIPIVELIGAGPALELLLTGELVDAERALGIGLVSRVVPDQDVAAVGDALAERIAGGAPRVNRWHKKFLRRLADSRPLTAAERAEPLEAFLTADYREGVRAFLEKRPPDFTGE